MAFKTNQSANGFYLSNDLAFISADNTKDNGYDATTSASNGLGISTPYQTHSSIAIGYNIIAAGDTFDDAGGTNNGAVYVYDWSGTQLFKINGPVSGGLFSTGLSIADNKIFVGAMQSDRVYVYDLGGNIITTILGPAGTDTFGYSVAAGSGRIVVGAPREDVNASDDGCAYIYDYDGNQIAKLTNSSSSNFDEMGFSVAIGSGRIVVGSDQASTAFVYDLNGNELFRLDYPPGGTSSSYGNAVAVGSGRIVVTEPEGASKTAWLYDINGNLIKELQPFGGTSGDRFGYAAAIGSGRVVISAILDDTNTFNDGSLYVYDLDGNSIEKVTDVSPAGNGQFGLECDAGYGKIAGGSGTDDITVYDIPNSGTTHILDIFD